MYRKYTGFRREENFADFEKSKEGILKKWNKLWEGGQQLMACGACQAKRTAGLASAGRMGTTPVRPQSSEAVLIRNIGNHAGSVSYRGKSGTTYHFGGGEERYVLSSDVEVFMRFPDQFVIVKPEVKSEIEIDLREPTLIADGPPV
jgi:hypothetical protein